MMIDEKVSASLMKEKQDLQRMKEEIKQELKQEIRQELRREIYKIVRECLRTEPVNIKLKLQ